MGHHSAVAALGAEQGPMVVGLWSQLGLERELQADWKLVSVAVESTLVVVGILAAAAAAAAVVVDTGDEGPAVVPVEQELEDRKERNREWVFVKAAAASSAGVGVGVVPYRGLVPLRAKRGDRVLGEARLEQLWAMIY